jgi:DNA-binding NarL/FixJ family response regulator
LVRVVIAEDEQMFRQVLCKICTTEFGCEIVGEAGDGPTALRLVAETQPDLLLLDLNLPQLDGFCVAREAKRVSSSTRVVAVTASHGSYTLFRVERGGFDGYVDKGSNSLTALREAFAACAVGRRYFSPTFLSEKASRLRDPKAFDKVLSDREREVLSWIGLSLDNHEISRKLGIRPRTVETFRCRILRKLGLRGTPKLIRFAIERGFTEVFG